MIAVKALYDQGRIEFIEPIPANIATAELNIVVIPSDSISAVGNPADTLRVRGKSSEEDFKEIGLAAFFDTDDDTNVDWEDYFGLEQE